MFVGRKAELDFFEEKYRSPGGQLIILYGRRRIGKTEILRRFCNGKPHVFYSCREVSDVEQRAAFSDRVLSSGSPAARYIKVFADWEAAFRGILELPSGRRKKLLIIDEFPYMCRGNPAIPSVLQILWDEILHSKNVMLVLCGSAMSFMENKILSEKSPLYGRATGIFKVKELPFYEAVKFFPNYSPEDKLLAYAILGGVPHYLQQFDCTLSLSANIVKNVLTKGSVLYSEVEFLMRQELREPAMYNTIIETVAWGNTQLNDIYNKTQIDKVKISVYLKNLRELQIIEREFSVLSGDKAQATSTRGLYRITDNFFRFWYRFVSPNLSDLEAGDAQGVFQYAVGPKLNEFAALVFENVCREFVRNKNRAGAWPFRIAKLGRWWGKLKKNYSYENGKTKLTTVEAEIDLVAVDEAAGHYFIGECKFKNARCELTELHKLQDKAPESSPGTELYYGLFSKSGFAKKLAAAARLNPHIMLFTLEDILSGEPVVSLY
jgi:AAA+ ATPase superfamily predicted ATPase